MATTDHSNARNGTRGAGLDAVDDPVTDASPEAVESAVEAVEATADAPDAAATAETAEAATEVDDRIGLSDPDVISEGGDPAAAPTRLDVTPGFLAELSGAMRSVVGRERDRIQALIDEDKERHVAQAREQSAAEAEAFRRVADEDVAAIEAWADEETERIRAEAATRVADRRADLEAYLVQHEAVLQGELDGIEAAVSSYQTSLGGFLDDLDTTNDPEEIAHRAHEIPRAPDLETVRSLARADALTRLAEQAMAEEAAHAPEPTEVETAVTDLASDAATADEAVAAPTDAIASADARDDLGWGSPLSEGGDTAPVTAVATAVEAEVTDGADAVGDTLAGGNNGASGWLRDDDRSAGSFEAVAESGLAGESDTDFGLGSMVDESPGSVEAPVATMDAVAGSDAASSPATSPEAAVAVSSEPSFGHTNAAVRLIRSVAPWTAPSHGDHQDERRD